MRYFLFILIAVVILLVMIVIHELGHYVAGKIFKFKINEFSVGFGPQLLSKTNKKTGEKFSLRLIPLGGYCAFEDESGAIAESERLEAEARVPSDGEVFPSLETGEQTIMPPPVDPLAPIEEQIKGRSFTEEAPWKRIIVLFSGALFNFISAIIFSFICILAVGYALPRVAEVYTDENGIAYCRELQTDDVILAVGGERLGLMKNYNDLVETVEGNTYVLTVLRGGEETVVTVTMRNISNLETPYVGLGISSPNDHSVKCGFGTAIKYCVPYTIKLAFSILAAFGGLITGSVPLNSMTGPVGTVDFMARLGMTDLRNFLILLPLIAANLAIFNVLPIPALDGSKIVFTTIEWVRGKPLNRTVENIIHTVGLLLLFAFVIVIDLWGVFT